MQGLITLDFGNSHPHAGLFQKRQGIWKLLEVVKIDELNIKLKEHQLNAHNSSIVLCEVKKRDAIIKNLQEDGFLITQMSEYWRGQKFFGMPVHYAKTIGEDRLIEAFYLYKNFELPALVIDAGTFVTMDLVTQNGFKGGFILPGGKVYFEMFSKGELLKNNILSTTPTSLLPQTTSDAMSSSYKAFIFLARDLVERYEIKKIFLTGGDLNLWANFLSSIGMNDIVEEHPHLIHWALHHWMTTQIEIL